MAHRARLAMGHDPTERFLAICPYGQLNNQRISVQNAAAVARETNRTLLLNDQLQMYATTWDTVVDLEPLRRFMRGRLKLVQVQPRGRGENGVARIRAWWAPGEHCMRTTMACVDETPGGQEDPLSTCQEHCADCAFAGAPNAEPLRIHYPPESARDRTTRRWPRLLRMLGSHPERLLALSGRSAFILRPPSYELDALALVDRYRLLPDMPAAAPLREIATVILRALVPGADVQEEAGVLWPPAITGGADGTRVCGYHLRVKDRFRPDVGPADLIRALSLHAAGSHCSHIFVATDADRRRRVALLSSLEDSLGSCTVCKPRSGCTVACGPARVQIGCPVGLCDREIDFVVVEQLVVAASHIFVGLGASTFSNTVVYMRNRAAAMATMHFEGFTALESLVRK